MSLSQKTLLAAVAAFAILSSSPRAGEDGLVSTMSLMYGVSEARGITVAVVKDAPTNVYTEDYAPPQVLEIIRPDMGPVTIGRLNTSCTCIQASLPKRSFAQGERIFIEVRNVQHSKGGNYAIFIQLTSPVKELLQAELWVQSTREKGQKAAPAPAQTTPKPEPAKPAPVFTQPATPSAQQPTGTPQPRVVPRSGGPVIRYEDITPYPSRGR